MKDKTYLKLEEQVTESASRRVKQVGARQEIARVQDVKKDKIVKTTVGHNRVRTAEDKTEHVHGLHAVPSSE